MNFFSIFREKITFFTHNPVAMSAFAKDNNTSDNNNTEEAEETQQDMASTSTSTSPTVRTACR